MDCFKFCYLLRILLCGEHSHQLYEEVCFPTKIHSFFSNHFLNEAVRFFIHVLLRCINIVLTLTFEWHYGNERNIIVSVCEKP